MQTAITDILISNQHFSFSNVVVGHPISHMAAHFVGRHIGIGVDKQVILIIDLDNLVRDLTAPPSSEELLPSFDQGATDYSSPSHTGPAVGKIGIRHGKLPC